MKAVEKDPTLLGDLQTLVASTTRGDPESPLVWTARSHRHLVGGSARSARPSDEHEDGGAAAKGARLSAYTRIGNASKARSIRIAMPSSRTSTKRSGGKPGDGEPTRPRRTSSISAALARSDRRPGARLRRRDARRRDAGIGVGIGGAHVALHSMWLQRVPALAGFL